MIDRYIAAAIVSIFVVCMSYVAHFYFRLNYTVSGDAAVWGQFGDFFGGVLNPTLNFISIVLLIKSLHLQHEANDGLRAELINSEKIEKIRSFETLFFNMINSQKSAFDAFKISVDDDFFCCSEAVNYIENEIDSFREKGLGDSSVKEFIDDLDSNDQIFSSARIFYIMVKIISEKLSDANGFAESDRRAHLLTLINFTDFSLLRLIMVAIQFMDCHPVNYLRDSVEFNSALEEVGLNYSSY